MRETIFGVTEAAEEGWDARALGHSAFTQGGNRDDPKETVRDAVPCNTFDPELVG